VLSAADFALCASGTATLEVAWHNVPMVVMYNGSKWGYRIVGRFLITTPHLSLVNILAGRRVVPEFMPYYTSTQPIAAEALDILGNPARQARIKADLRAVIDSLGHDNAAQRTAQLAIDLAAR
jgi:lipid-A-disaccharide synthase